LRQRLWIKKREKKGLSIYESDFAIAPLLKARHVHQKGREKKKGQSEKWITRGLELIAAAALDQKKEVEKNG
jgi:hypothetical protein